MKTFIKHLAIAAAATVIGGTALAQGSTEYKAGIKIPLDEKGTKYIRFITWNQMWVRNIQNNAGTASVADQTQAATGNWDIGVRRARALWYAQITPRYLVLTHFGINNQTFNAGGASGLSSATTTGYAVNKKPQIFLHDFWNEYRVFRSDKEIEANGNKAKFENNSLYIGAGLHYWHGVSRMASASTLNFLTIDAPVWNWYDIEATDQFARQFGLYAKGKIATHLDYRVYLNKPFLLDQRSSAKSFDAASTTSLSKSRAYNAPTDKFSYGGYFSWQFWEQEANVLPFTVGTYVGTKKVFNIGAGFNYAPQATIAYTRKDTVGANPNTLVLTDSARYNQLNYGVDMFLDLPLGEKGANGAITAYGLFQHNNLGSNYYRSTGIMNISPGWVTGANAPKAGEKSIDGSGNARALLGTGNIMYVQAGYLLPKFSESYRIQPFAAYTNKSLDYIGKSLNYIDAGFNLFMDGHHSKISVQYSTRPVVTGSTAVEASRVVGNSKGELIIQAQVYL